MDSISDCELANGLQFAVKSELDKPTLIQLLQAVKQAAGRLNLNVCSRGTVALVLDRVISTVIILLIVYFAKRFKAH